MAIYATMGVDGRLALQLFRRTHDEHISVATSSFSVQITNCPLDAPYFKDQSLDSHSLQVASVLHPDPAMVRLDMSPAPIYSFITGSDQLPGTIPPQEDTRGTVTHEISLYVVILVRFGGLKTVFLFAALR
ncbi:hypothetical protein FRC03_005175 [Tulasnella sp. 419]|nr:hypothetical protein FRC03_005175 [Tulasnella sp. 419]